MRLQQLHGNRQTNTMSESAPLFSTIFVPEQMQRIVDPQNENHDATAFRLWKSRSRSLNSCTAFASTQVREAHIPPPRGGGAPPQFILNGHVHHNIGALQAIHIKPKLNSIQILIPSSCVLF